MISDLDVGFPVLRNVPKHLSITFSYLYFDENMSWEDIRTKVGEILKSKIPGIEVYPYKYYLHVKKGDKGIRLMYSYGRFRILDESTRKVIILKPNITAEEIAEEISKILS